MEEIDSFKLGDINVVITESSKPDRYDVSCHDDQFKYEFSVRHYEYENYNKLMKSSIKRVFKEKYNNAAGK